MKLINLLPAKILAAQNKRRLIAGLGSALLVSLVVSGLLWQFWHLQIAVMENKETDLRTRDSLWVKQEKESSLLAQKNQDLLNRVTQINNYSKTEIDWAAVYSFVGRVTPKDVKLNSLNLVTLPAGQGVSFKMGGSTGSNVSFAAFVQTLKQNPEILEAKIDSYNYEAKTGSVSFAASGKFTLSLLAYPSSGLVRK